jgi:hypothetical protein
MHKETKGRAAQKDLCTTHYQLLRSAYEHSTRQGACTSYYQSVKQQSTVSFKTSGNNLIRQYVESSAQS